LRARGAAVKTKHQANQLKVGVVGLGNMGAPIAKTLVRAGFPVTGFDIRAEAVAELVEAGADGAGQIEDLVSSVDVVSTVVVTEDQVRDVAAAMARTSPRADTFVIHSTVTPAFVQALAAEMSNVNIGVVDASVAGGIARARTGDLTVMAGGDDAAFERARPVLEAISSELFHCGASGAGAVTKLVVNYLTIGTYLLQLEAMQLAASYGLDEDAITAVVSTSNADSRGIRTWGYHDRTRRASASAGTASPAELMHKDLRSLVLAAHHKGLDLPLADLAARRVIEALRDRDTSLKENPRPEVPTCKICGIELAAPFRAGGVHPECVR
jgi:3-hydroxyisobutyrate dehydrogenase-like beta-hydroxyacid dehydrogenase